MQLHEAVQFSQALFGEVREGVKNIPMGVLTIFTIVRGDPTILSVFRGGNINSGISRGRQSFFFLFSGGHREID